MPESTSTDASAPLSGSGGAASASEDGGTPEEDGAGAVRGGMNGMAGSGGNEAQGGLASDAGTVGADGGEPGVDTCGELACPDLGECSLVEEGDGCLRICSFDGTVGDITNVYAIRSAEDLARLAQLSCHVIEGSLRIEGNGVEDLSGLASIREISGSLQVLGSNLTSIELPALKVVGGTNMLLGTEAVTFIALPAVTDVELPSLESVGGAVNISVDPQLASIDLGSLETVETLQISNNDELARLNTSPTLQPGSLWISENPKLPQCEVDAIAERTGASCVCSGNDATATCN